MTTPAQIRKAALALPETTETRGTPTVYAVRGVTFATVTADRRLTVPGGEHVALAEVNGMQSNALVRDAWFAAAPDDLAERLRAADSAVAGEVGDLPKAIGTPATRALVEHGVTSLADLKGIDGAELASWHGVGPKAVRILEDQRNRSTSRE